MPLALDDLLRAVAEEIGIPDLALNINGICQIVVDGHLEITLEDFPLEQCAHFYSTVASAPANGRKEFFSVLLEAQLFGREIGEGMAFGFESATGEILLCRKLTLTKLEVADFASALSEFMNWAEHWKDKLGTLLDADSDDSAPMPSFEHLIRA